MARPAKQHEWVNGIEGKVCSRCKLWKPLDEYYQHAQKTDGLDSSCMSCRKAIRNKTRKKKPAVVGRPPAGHYSIMDDPCNNWSPLHILTSTELTKEIRAEHVAIGAMIEHEGGTIYELSMSGKLIVRKKRDLPNDKPKAHQED